MDLGQFLLQLPVEALGLSLRCRQADCQGDGGEVILDLTHGLETVQTVDPTARRAYCLRLLFTDPVGAEDDLRF